MMFTPKTQGTGVLLSLGRRSAPWAMALAFGSIFLACSGTIDTPTDEYPTRSSSASSSDDDDAPAATPARNNSQSASTTPRAPAAASSDDDDAPTTPAASDDEPPAASDDEPPAASDDEPPAASGGATLAFEADVYPIFSTTCAPCHAGSSFGGNDIGDPDVAKAFDDATRVADRVIALVESGTMPPQCNGGAPGDTGCMKADDFDIVKAWVEAGSPE